VRAAIVNVRAFSASFAASFILVLLLATCGACLAADILPPAQPNAEAVDGDLSNLVFTAIAPTAATLVSPADGGYGGAATPFVVSTGPGAGVELSVNGSVVPFSHIGKRDVVRATGETSYTYFGVGLVPGPNTIVLTPLGANGARFKPSTYTVYGRGPAVSVRATFAGRLIADGKSASVLHVTALDRWEHPAMAGVGFGAVVRAGDVRLGTAASTLRAPPESAPLAAPDLPGPEITASAPPSGFATSNGNAQLGTPSGGGEYRAIAGADGTVDIPVIAGLRSGAVSIDVWSGDPTNVTTARTFVWPYLRHPIVTGLVTGGFGAVPGDPGTDATAPYEANSRLGRIALYGAGQIAPTMSASLAYDTAGALDESSSYGSFDEDPNARPYLTYGDASVRRDDALSTAHLYAQIDDGLSSAMFGEFVAKTGDDAPGSLGGFDLLMNGARIDVADAAKKLELFHATAGVSYGRQVFAPNGLATTAYDLQPNVVVGSDSLTLVAIDRHAGFIVSETALVRNVDYTIDYASGVVRFINPPLAFDPSFNPQQILVQYEYAGSGNVATGGSVKATLGALKVGAGYATDATGSGNVSLFDQSLSGSLGSGTFSVEHLGTNGGIGNALPAAGQTVDAGDSSRGDAYRAALTGGLGALRYEGVVQSTTQGFNDPFGGLSTPGLTSARVSLTKPITGGDVSLAFDAELDSLYGAKSSDTSATLRLHHTIGKRIKATAALSERIISNNGATPSNEATSTVSQPLDALAPALPQSAAVAAVPTGATAGGVTQGELGATYAFSPAVNASLDRVFDLGGTDLAASSNPAQTTAEITAALGKGSRAYFRELWTDSATQSFALSTQALTAAAASTHVTQLGIERQIGSATTIDTEYSIENVANGSDLYAAIGVKQRVIATNTLRGDVTLQHALAAGDGTGGFDVYGLSLAYDRGSPFRATTSYQLRTGETPGATFTVGAAGYLGSGVSLISSVDDVRSVGIATEDERVGIAYRPQEDDRSSVLFGYDHLEGVGDVQGEETDVVSADAVHRLSAKLEATVRVAYEIDGDQYYPAHTSAAGLRLVRRLGPRLDVATDVRLSSTSDVPGSATTGYAAEIGYRIADAFRVAGGYDFTKTPDLSLAQAPHPRGFYLTATSVVTSLFGFGRDR
jgi:hypothetical protein